MVSGSVLLTAIHEWLHWTDPESPDERYRLQPHTTATTTVTRLIRKQNDIGWHHIFLGRFCTDWSEIQDSYYATTLNTKDNKRRTGQRWQQAIIGELWSHWFILWEMRNNDLHGATESAKTSAARMEVERTLRDIYDLREQMKPSVQQLLCRDITDHFAKPLWYNRNWFAVHGPLVKKSVQRAKKKAIQGVRSIRQYFFPR